MPATRAATQRAEAQRAALLATASNADTQPLNPELVESVIKHLPRSQLASARLVSKQFAAAVDPLIRAVAISLKKSWGGRVTPSLGLRHVTRLDGGSDVKGAAKWRQLQHITSQLPKLNTLRLLSASDRFPGAFISSLSSLSSLTRLDLDMEIVLIGYAGNPFPEGVQLPGLRAASFATSPHLADIVAFAPNLEHLNSTYLKVGDDRPAALPACTHFGGDFSGIISTEPAQAFAAAFPNLQVLTYLPIAMHKATGQLATALSAQRLLAQLPSVRAVRGWSRRVVRKAAAAWPLALPQLQRLCLQGMEGLDIPSISSMSQLQHVCITFVNADETTSQALVRALAAPPQLQSLVLPAGLLCSQCCPGVQSSLAALTAKSSLKQLVFLEWQQPSNRMFEAGFGCTHPDAIQAGLQCVAAAAAAPPPAASTQQHQSQQQQQQLIILHQQQHQSRVMVRNSEANPDSAAGVWGVYGPPGEW